MGHIFEHYVPKPCSDASRAVKFIPTACFLQATLSITLHIVLAAPDGLAFTIVEDSDVVIVVFHALPDVEDQVFEAGRLVAALAGLEVRAEVFEAMEGDHDAETIRKFGSLCLSIQRH